MADIKVLDKNSTSVLKEEDDLTPQIMYVLDTSGVTFTENSKLRLAVNLVRTNTAVEICEYDPDNPGESPDPDAVIEEPDLSCADGGDCHESEDCSADSGGALNISSTGDGSSVSMDCRSGESLALFCCGGHAPYTWSSTGGIQLSASEGTSTVATPPVNTGSAVAGQAFKQSYNYQQALGGEGGFCGCGFCEEFYGCNENLITSIGGNGRATCGGSPIPVSFGNCVGAGVCAGSCSGGCTPNTNLGTPPTGCGSGMPSFAGTSYCDLRTAPMIAAGCNPCRIAVRGATVTVTDADGTQVTIALTAGN